MSVDDLPFMPFWVKDWIAATMHWAGAERGAYFQLLCFQWVNGRVPPDVSQLARITGFDETEFESIWRTVGERSLSSTAGSLAVSLSVGVALFPSRDVRGREDLIRCAELALGRAKRDGMNRICVFQQHDLVYTPHAGPAPMPRPATSSP